MTDRNAQVLANAIEKFLKWDNEYAALKAELAAGFDAADLLLDAVYGDRSKVEKLIGGSNAPIFRDAAALIVTLQGRLQAGGGI